MWYSTSYADLGHKKQEHWNIFQQHPAYSLGSSLQVLTEPNINWLWMGTGMSNVAKCSCPSTSDFFDSLIKLHSGLEDASEIVGAFIVETNISQHAYHTRREVQPIRNMYEKWYRGHDWSFVHLRLSQPDIDFPFIDFHHVFPLADIA
jgi:hypothetical protein